MRHVSEVAQTVLTKTCITCKHCIVYALDPACSQCSLYPKPQNVVTGIKEFTFCENARNFLACGPDGKKWEEKTTP